MTLVNAQHVTASVFINDDASPEAGCTTAPAKLAAEFACGKPLSWTKGQAADARLKRHGPPSEAVAVAVTEGRLDGSTEGFDRGLRPSSAEGLTPKSLAPGTGSFKARRNGWPGSLDGRRRKRVLVKIIGE